MPSSNYSLPLLIRAFTTKEESGIAGGEIISPYFVHESLISLLAVDSNQSSLLTLIGHFSVIRELCSTSQRDFVSALEEVSGLMTSHSVAHLLHTSSVLMCQESVADVYQKCVLMSLNPL